MNQNLKVKLDSNSKQAAIKYGVSYFDKNRNGFSKASQLEFHFNQNNRLMLKDLFWEGEWQEDINHKKVVFWDTEHFLSVRDFSLENVDLDDMQGFDFAPLILQMKNVPPWEGGSFIQHYLHIPGIDRTQWKEGNLEYFFMPKSFPEVSGSHIPQFYKYFPDYNLPKNKIGINNFIITNDSSNTIASKGYTYTAAYIGPRAKAVMYNYDNWLYESGAPAAYSVSQQKINEWLAAVDENLLYANFEKYVLNHYTDIGHLVLNWEALQAPNGTGLYKLENCLKKWKEKYPETSISLWPRGAFELSRVNIEGNNYKNELSADLKFNGNLDLWRKERESASPFSIDAFLKDNADINYIGGYLNYPTNYGFVHHFVMQHMMNKKFFPAKKSVLMWWNQQEYVGDFEMGKQWFIGANGDSLNIETKPMVFPSAMHNAAVWAFAFCDGGELWSEPYGRSDDKEFLGANTNVFDKNSNRISTSSNPFQNGQYAVQNYRNIDRWEGGKWAVSANKDIIEAQSDWDFIPSARENESFSEGIETLPSYSLYDKKPLVVAKKSEDNLEALVIVYDAWNDPLKEELINVKIGSQVYSIKVFGRYSSVVRLSL